MVVLAIIETKENSMKKLALTSVLAVFAVSSANAATNYFVGGGFSMSQDNEHRTSYVSVSPEFGWKVNSNWDLGAAASFAVNHGYLPSAYGVPGNIYDYGFDVFARYNVAQFGGVKLLLKGSVGMDFRTYAPDDFDNESTRSVNASIVPMITYDISEAFTLYTRLNFLGVYAEYRAEDKVLFTDKGWNIDVFGNSNNVAAVNNIQIGFHYNF